MFVKPCSVIDHHSCTCLPRPIIPYLRSTPQENVNVQLSRHDVLLILPFTRLTVRETRAPLIVDTMILLVRRVYHIAFAFSLSQKARVLHEMSPRSLKQAPSMVNILWQSKESSLDRGRISSSGCNIQLPQGAVRR